MGNENLARATASSDLGFEETMVHDVDRVAAMGGGNELGGLLFRYREAKQDRWGYRIELILARRVMDKFRVTRSIAEKVGAAVLVEFSHPHCVQCNGAREIVTDQLKVVCDGCNGTGKQFYSNGTRRLAVGTYGSRIDQAFAFCHGEMANALGAFLGHTHGRLQ